MPAIATMFDGIQYRSRLEARWAAFMHNIGWEHTYEPVDGDGYIPDFIVHGARPLFIEVKPAITLADYQEPQQKVDKGLKDYEHDVLIVGVSPFPVFTNRSWYPEAGWMGEHLGQDENGGYMSWDRGLWITCRHCHRIAVFHDLMSYGGRPCWCIGGGDHHMAEPPLDVMRSMWADACNEVRWKGRAA